jgi:hypothetical protein
MEGRADAHLPNRVPQRVDLRHQQVRPAVEQVHREEERSTRNPVAATVRHEGRMSRLGYGGMRCAFRPTLYTLGSDIGGRWREMLDLRSPRTPLADVETADAAYGTVPPEL